METSFEVEIDSHHGPTLPHPSCLEGAYPIQIPFNRSHIKCGRKSAVERR